MILVPEQPQDDEWWRTLLPKKLPPGWAVLSELDGTALMYESDKGLRVMVSGMVEADQKRWYHVSLSRRSRLPDWEDIKWVKTLFIGEDRLAIQIFPPKEQYVNFHKHCLHLWHCFDGAGIPDFASLRPRVNGGPMV